MQQPDKLTETRGSIDMKSSLFRRFYSIMCPCFSSYKDKQVTDRNDIDYFASDLENRSSTREYEMARKYTMDFAPYLSYKLPEPFLDQELGTGSYPNHQELSKKGHKSRSFMYQISNSPQKQRITARETVDLTKELGQMTYTKKKEWYNFPVFKHNEGQLILLGKQNKNLLAEISTVKLEPSPTAVQKQLSLKMGSQKSSQLQKKLQDFWNSRYYYFQKFDQMIQIDKESISNLTPQAVSDYIAGKCFDCKTALDAFSGIGHNATKLGTLCEKVICVQEEPKKCNMLINNAKCYEIYNIELFMKPFLQINLKQKVDVALIHPQLVNPDYLLSSMCEPKHFKPHLSSIIKKSLQVANNIVLLLPPNISIKDICYEISKSSQQIQDKVFCSCSVKIEKIYFRNKLSYVAVFFGNNVQQSIKINSELGFIYKLLKNPDDRNFLYKKLIKYLREKYGIIRLLNIVSESVGIERPGKTEIQKLVDFVRQRKLILEHKLQNLLVEEKSTPRKATFRSNTNDDISSSLTNSPDIKAITQPFSFSIQGQLNLHHPRIPQDEQQFQQQQQQQQAQLQEGQTISQRTQSFYSSVSGFSAFKKRQTITQSIKRTENYSKNTHSDNNIERESNSSSIVVRKILDDEGSLEKNSKSPASPQQKGAVWRSGVGVKLQHNHDNDQDDSNSNSNSQVKNDVKSGNMKAYRHTLESKKMEGEMTMMMSAKQNLKMTLIEK